MNTDHDPGGKKYIPLMEGVKGSAFFGGENDCYRYGLIRKWDESLPAVLFIMMNPSTADPMHDDPTVFKCQKFARSWGYGRLFVANTFAYRATDQNRLIEVSDPIGPYNDAVIEKLSKKADKVIFAYGKPKHKKLRSRGLDVAKTLIANHIKPYVLRLSNDGTPYHPLYLPDNSQPIEWNIE